ncbi:MAG: tetratricopeptide repeat protein [Chitinivibrionia bacterium]|jgi:tetratricopeptide (TPR) repeat protein|nr:tetratricopeptide repeat protein [Chitinivibrionia bacterium]
MKGLLLVFLLLFMGGCAYVNTLYNGAEAFRRAQRIERQGARMSRDSAVIARQTEPLYRRAIEKAQKVLLEFPRSERAHDNAYFLKGLSLFALGEYMSAINDFEILLEFFPESRFVPRSLLKLARANARVGDFLASYAYVNEILERFPEMASNQDLVMLRADLAIELEGTMAAISALEERLAQTTDPRARLIIIERLMTLNMNTGDYERALSYTENLPNFDRRLAQNFYRVEFRKLQCLRRLYRRREAIEFATLMLSRPAYLYNRTEIMLEKAITLIDMGRFDEGIRIFDEIIAIGGDPRVRGRTWFEFATVNIDIRGLLDTAEIQLDSALALTPREDEELRQRITQRQEGLRNIRNLRAQMNEADPFEPIDSAYFRLRIGTQFWLSALLPDSAMAYFGTLVEARQTPDSVRAIALFAMAYIYRDIKNDTITSDSIFNSIILNYPQFEAAKAAQEQLGLEITLMTRRDSANVQFAVAEQLMIDNDGEFSQDAYHAYLLTALRFPDIEDVAARALFAAGWLANRRATTRDGVLDTTVAMVFLRLCDLYPESEQCKAAQEMMNINEAQAFAQEHAARLEATAAELLGNEARREDEEDGTATPQERRAILPDFQSWI